MNRIEKYKIIRQILRFDEKVNILLNKIIDKAKEKYDLQTKCYEDHFLYKNFNFRDLSLNLAIDGDLFIEKIFDQDKLLMIQHLPTNTMYRIETINGNLIEFQQSKNGANYDIISKSPLTKEKNLDEYCVRFLPNEIIHCRIPTVISTTEIFENYSYGTSLLEKNPIFWCEKDSDKIAKIMANCIEKLIEEYNN